MPQFWKQLLNNPKSISSDSLPVPENKPRNRSRTNSTTQPVSSSLKSSSHDRPMLTNRPYSYNPSASGSTKSTSPLKLGTSSQQQSQNSLSTTAQSGEYKDYRDKFLSNRNGFVGRVFGVSLSESLGVASAEVIVQSELVSFGRIPIVIAKCGAYLKANALETPGIFRIAGNGKRVKELQFIFSSPPSYGAKFTDWDGYSIHDVASLLRRYLNNLDEPLIPLEFYESFRKPIQDRPRISKHMLTRHVSHPNANKENSITIESMSKQSQSQQNTKAIPSPSTDTTASSPMDIPVKKTSIDDIVAAASAPTPTCESAPVPAASPQGKTNIPDAQRPQDMLMKSHRYESYEADKENENDEDENEEARKRRKQRHKKKLARDIKSAIKEYEALFVQLSNDTKQLTIYLLDLMSLFARQSQLNLMTARNLAAIFQPSLLSHPQHDMDPKEYELSRFVVEFLIEYSYKLLPNLLKITKEEQDKTIAKGSRQSSSATSQHPPRILTPGSATHSQHSGLPEGEQGNRPYPIRSLTPTSGVGSSAIEIPQRSAVSPLPNVVDRSPHKQQHDAQKLGMSLQLQVPKTRSRPHSRSIGSAPVPPDVISSNKRKTKLFPWLHKPGILSDNGETSATEYEGDDVLLSNDEDTSSPHSPVARRKLNVPKMANNSNSGSSLPTTTVYSNGNSPLNSHSHLKVPQTTKASVKGRTSSTSRVRPISMFIDSSKSKSVDELGYLSSSTSAQPNVDTESRTARSKKRESWFQRWTSRSNSATRS
ncbi:GTPase-activating protein [Maudiozyma humilis]|uniref:GTPase-activating protein n=1 Tax=Maudiozyma humilis TaxID=51915 RepID=A0AAV5S7G7_MAUHU|nr:GTPase-activating protein [Kazachstania humilis]